MGEGEFIFLPHASRNDTAAMHTTGIARLSGLVKTKQNKKLDIQRGTCWSLWRELEGGKKEKISYFICMHEILKNKGKIKF